ncbi:hypothetical protein V8G54_004089 [Vigna mungo]|uniref:Uncharacterized protein n=1 Tax=Vigna mungo TaxID=3915 RepID=A0AAQ3PBP7_VIGMU
MMMRPMSRTHKAISQFMQPAVHHKMDSYTEYTYNSEKESLLCKLLKVGIHALRDGFKKFWFLHAWMQGILGFPNNLFNHRFFVQIFPTHYASYFVGSKASLNTFLQQHCGNAKCSSTLKRHIPAITF